MTTLLYQHDMYNSLQLLSQEAQLSHRDHRVTLALKSVETLSSAAQMYKKSHMKRFE